MSEPVILTAMQTVTARFQGIAVAAGYHTDLGATVRTGWPRALIAGHDVTLPVTALHPDTDARDSGHGAAVRATRRVAVEVIAWHQETSPEWLDRALYDIRRALIGVADQTDGVITAETGDAEWSEIEDTGLVRLIVPVILTYADRYGA